MARPLPVKFILCLKFLFFLLMIQSLWPSITLPWNGSDLKDTGDLPPEVLDSVKDVLSKFQAPSTSTDLPFMPGPAGESLEIDVPGLAEFLAIPGASHHARGSDCLCESRVYYFFSFSMPSESIGFAIGDALRINAGCGKKVTLVLRGLIENSLKTTIKKFYGLMKERKIQGDWPVTIDPPLFEKYGIAEVPTLVMEKAGNIWKIKGDLRMEASLEKFEADPEDFGKYGNTFSIGEESISTIIASKQKEIEGLVKKKAEERRKTVTLLTRYDGKFGKAQELRVYYVDPSVILTEDIIAPDGRVLFAKGSVYSPADYLNLGRYVIIDGKDPKQVEFALKGDFKKIILLSGDLAALNKRHQTRFYLANDTIINKLEIEKVPAVIEKEGAFIRVTEKKID